MPHALFLGLSTIDILYRVDAFPAPNTKIASHSQHIFAGGPATNAAIAFRHLGGHATLLSALGRHPLASAITAELENYNVTHRDLAPQHEASPPIASITVNAAGDRNVVSPWRSPIPLPPAHIDQPLLAAASILLVDGHSMPAAQAWAAAAHARGIPVVLDAGSWKPGTPELLPHIDAAICSADFLPPACLTPDDVLAYLQAAAVPRIAITHGPAPIRFFEHNASGAKTSGQIPVPPIQAVDTMGAGDVFHGAFCYYAATGLTFQQSLHQAAAIAARSCQSPGPRAWMIC